MSLQNCSKRKIFEAIVFFAASNQCTAATAANTTLFDTAAGASRPNGGSYVQNVMFSPVPN